MPFHLCFDATSTVEEIAMKPSTARRSQRHDTSCIQLTKNGHAVFPSKSKGVLRGGV